MNDFTSLQPDGKRKARRLVKGVKSITEFFGDAVEAFKGTGFPAAIEKAAPWAGVVGEAAADALPPLKFFTKIIEELTKETDPEKLGLTACTIAYQRAVEKAFKAESAPTDEKHAIAEARAQLDLLPACEEVDIGTFSLKTPLEHEFVELANLHLQTVAIKVGYTEGQVDRITAQVQETFQHCLTLLLADAKTAEKFAPFKSYLELGGGEERQARKALAAHANYQRWLYEEAPVLGRSPFALKHVYIETECGKLTWGEIKPDPRSAAPRLNPFSEEHGGRQPLIKTVLDLIASPDLKEAIVVQGMAGAGKSSFTLKLCDELLKRHLHPIRIRIKDLGFDTHIKDALPNAVLFGDDDYLAAAPPVSNLFLDYSILGERGVGLYQQVCKYVFIFDGWDEISLSNKGFQQKVAQGFEMQSSSCQLHRRLLEAQVSRCRAHHCGADLGACASGLYRCSSDLGACGFELDHCGSDLSVCSFELDHYGSELGVCTSEPHRYISELDTCASEAQRCGSELDRCGFDLDGCASELDSCASELHR